METNYKELLEQIKCFIFDVDGVLTNGKLLISDQGTLLRSMNVKDGFAMKYALSRGFNVCIISGGTNEGVRERLKTLGITDVYLGAHDKVEILDEYLDVYEISRDEVAYMGDDIPDVYPMKEVLLPTCPQNAVPEVKKIAKYISHKDGGKGCVRDLIEQVLKTQGKWAI
ncbi:KdsC family phosphatase [Psychroflexus planctonicus]|uniref:3-deoxy-D-manno-octulosonate 8-phosphate phosphatase n=1 Tax=Psychroflexus planctonicus TaxID=1526575 RepID=A0ABQ1SLI2_9FLAO|nr:HAD-IIIA family hydrolase [Psychroflexus planctonicus]GGE42724.1 3-deoxy-D-manno-octulosonate 8-phosphate phosphatase [Psychroflexus planctonicus]